MRCKHFLRLKDYNKCVIFYLLLTDFYFSSANFMYY